MDRSLVRVAVVGVMLAACDGAGPGASPDPGAQGPGGGGPEAAPMQVEVVHVSAGPIERWYRSSGTLEAVRSAELVAVQPAIITAVMVDEGDRVKEGEPLARLDGRALSLQADAARLELDNLQAELRRLESASPGAISREEIDKQRYLVEQARATLKLSRHQAKQTVIRAPFAGTIVTRYVDEGNLATTATPLFHLADLDVLELPLHLPERDAATVRIGAEVEVELVDGTAFIARIERRAPVVDALTGTVKFTMQATEAPAAAVPGAFARARVRVDARPSAPGLPRRAVFRIDDEPHVFIVEDGKAVRRAVTLGLEGTDRTEILAGLRGQDAVIVEGNAGITEGMPVEAVEAAAVEPAAARDDAAGS